MSYAEWKLEIIKLIVSEKRVRGARWKLDEINCVLVDDCNYEQLYKDGETPVDVWQGEIDAIADSQ